MTKAEARAKAAALVKEYTQYCGGVGAHYQLISRVSIALLDAVDAERERCAQIADDEGIKEPYDSCYVDGCNEVATAIRTSVLEAKEPTNG